MHSNRHGSWQVSDTRSGSRHSRVYYECKQYIVGLNGIHVALNKLTPAYQLRTIQMQVDFL